MATVHPGYEADVKLSVHHHRDVAALLRLIRLREAVELEEDRLRRSLTPDQLVGQACIRCHHTGPCLRPVLDLDGVQLLACSVSGACPRRAS